jgi:hypothetical protein
LLASSHQWLCIHNQHLCIHLIPFYLPFPLSDFPFKMMGHFSSTTLTITRVCMFKTRTRISNVICRGCFFAQWFEARLRWLFVFLILGILLTITV